MWNLYDTTVQVVLNISVACAIVLTVLILIAPVYDRRHKEKMRRARIHHPTHSPRYVHRHRRAYDWQREDSDGS